VRDDELVQLRGARLFLALARAVASVKAL
jgi:hypothetical protein